MSWQRPFNLIITGIGGQGVYTLTQVFLQICNEKGLRCQCSIFKGGAQKHGSIYSELRIFVGNNPDYSMYSTQIPKDDLDLIIGFEPFETFRFLEYFGDQTSIIFNTNKIPFHIEMLEAVKVEDPWEDTAQLNGKITKKNFTAESIDHFGDDKMLNFVLGLEVVKLKILPFDVTEYMSCFINRILPDDLRKNKMLNLMEKDE